MQKPVVGAVQSLLQALGAAAGARVEGLAIYSWEPEWVEELAKPHPLPPEKQVWMQGKVQVLATLTLGAGAGAGASWTPATPTEGTDTSAGVD